MKLCISHKQIHQQTAISYQNIVFILKRLHHVIFLVKTTTTPVSDHYDARWVKKLSLYIFESYTHTHRICFSFNYKHLEFIIQVLFLRKFTLPGFMLTFALLVIMWMRDTCRHFYLFLWTFSLSSETGINICYIGLRIHPARFLRIGVTCPVRWMWFSRLDEFVLIVIACGILLLLSTILLVEYTTAIL